MNGEYYLPLQNEGTHGVSIVSFDKTGKYTENTLTFISPSISSPILSLSSYVITKDNLAIIDGETSYPNSKVDVVLELEGNEIHKYTQTTREDGSFSVTTDNLTEPGIVSIWAESILSDNGNQFKEQWKNWGLENKIKPIFAHAYYPQDKGKVERTNRNITEELINIILLFHKLLSEQEITSWINWFNQKRFSYGVKDFPANLYVKN